MKKYFIIYIVEVFCELCISSISRYAVFKKGSMKFLL